MNNIEKIKAEIERRIKAYKTKNGFPAGTICAIRIETYEGLLSFIDSLPDENNPEPYNPVYDEDYLNEKIAKATKSWEGVDVDAMLAECRGYEEKPSEDLAEAAENIYKTPFGTRAEDFQAGAEWQAEQFAKIVRANLSEIGNNAQSQFEQLYFEITGTKMYGGYND